MQKQTFTILLAILLPLCSFAQEAIQLTNNNIKDFDLQIDGEYLYWRSLDTQSGEEIRQNYRYHLPSEQLEELPFGSDIYAVKDSLLAYVDMNPPLRLRYYNFNTEEDKAFELINNVPKELTIGSNLIAWVATNDDVDTRLIQEGNESSFSEEFNNSSHLQTWNYTTISQAENQGSGNINIHLISFEVDNRWSKKIGIWDSAHLEPNVYEDKIAWVQRNIFVELGDPNSPEIMLYDIPTETKTRITNNDLADTSPKLSGDYIVYQQEDADPWIEDSTTRIMLHNWKTGESRQINDNGVRSIEAQIYGGVVTWTDNLTDSRLLQLYNIRDNQRFTLTDQAHSIPVLTDQYLAYEVHSNKEDETSYEIYYHDLTQLPLSLPSIYQSQSLRLYPNPATDFITIETQQPLTSSMLIQVFDIQGQLIVEQRSSSNSNKLQLDSSDWQNGIYFVQVKNGEQVWVEKVIKR